jgi:NADH dehydrogenase
VHIFYLIDFRNRLVVLLDWAWAYFAYRRGSRLITGHRLQAGTPRLAAQVLLPAPPAVRAESPSPSPTT